MLRELESEIQAYGAGRPHRARLKQLLRKKEIVGDLCDQLRTRLARCLYDELGNERVAPGVAPLLAPAVAPAAGGAGSSATSTNSTGELATLLEASSDEAVSSIDEPAGGVGGAGGEHSAQWLAEQLSGLLQARAIAAFFFWVCLLGCQRCGQWLAERLCGLLPVRTVPSVRVHVPDAMFPITCCTTQHLHATICMCLPL